MEENCILLYISWCFSAVLRARGPGDIGKGGKGLRVEGRQGLDDLLLGQL